MSRTTEKTAKTVPEAIELALGELGLERGDAEVEVLDEGKSAIFGLLGGKMARVRVTERGGAGSGGPGVGGAGGAAGGSQPSGAAQGGESGYGGGWPAGAAASEGDGGSDGGGIPGAAGGAWAAGPEDPEGEGGGFAADDGFAPDAGPAAGGGAAGGGHPQAEDIHEGALRVTEFLGELFRGVHVTVQMDVAESADGVCIGISSEDSGILIGHRGETLDAFQYLANLYINKGRDEYIRVSLDIEDYRKKREDALVKIAERAAERVTRLRRNMTLDPMNSYERRIVHMALQGNQRIETHSVGDEPNRKIVVALKNRGGYYQSQRRY